MDRDYSDRGCLLIVLSAQAGYNCKCQDPSGVGPQWNSLTERVCEEQEAGSWIWCDINYAEDKAHQV